MKKKLLILIIPALFLISMDIVAKDFSVQFLTSGNCSMCEIRIEEAVKKLPGIKYIHWDFNTKIATVKYDISKIKLYAIMTQIADTGHDNEWVQAPIYAYQRLVGSCCEYPRTMDYSKVKPGYLSLMDVWLDVDESRNIDESISISPTSIINGVINITSQNTVIRDVNVLLYSLDGSVALSKPFSNLSDAKLDVSSLPKGCYIALVKEKQRIIYKAKLLLL
ncbi:MAG: TonB-dependent receptor [Ignavibacteria bacterium]|nr:TonB-dependent receptor [Ignavibacteria bacterium]